MVKFVSGKGQPQTYDEFVFGLNYSCYSYNRTRTPELTPDDWRCVFGDSVDLLEVRYQQELAGVSEVPSSGGRTT